MKKILYIFLPVLLIVFSCEEILLEDDISDKTVLLLAPSDNAQFTSTGITFVWDSVGNVSRYRIQVARPDFENPIQIVADNIVTGTSFTTQLNVGQYQWRVQGINSGYQTAFSTRSYTVVSNDDFGNNAVSLNLPSNNTVTNTPAQQLSWQPVLGASEYNLQIVADADNAVVLNENLAQASYSYTFPEGSFHWKVRATNGEGYTLFSERSILVDLTAPNTPILSSPENLTNTSDNDVTFEWSRVPIAGSTEKDSLYIYSDSNLSVLKYKNQQSSPYNTSTLANGTYFWYVKSFDAAGNSSQQSEVFSFTLN